MSSIRSGQDPLNSFIISGVVAPRQQQNRGLSDTFRAPATEQNSQGQRSLQELVAELIKRLTETTNQQDPSRQRERKNPTDRTQQFQDNPMLTAIMGLLELLIQLTSSAAKGAGNIIIAIFNFGGEGEKDPLKEMLKKQTKDPIAFDMGGDNQLDLTSAEDGVQFDLDGDGNKEQVAWSKAKGDDTDAFLALDRNGNGQIDNGKELFGDQNGKANGFEELKQFDKNQDGVIDEKDEVYQQLRTWQDKNHDGISQADEMQGLDKAGVKSINLNYRESDEKDIFGNEFRQQSQFERTDSKASEVAKRYGISLEDAQFGKVLDTWLGAVQ